MVKRRKAFTLIELLVVVSIIALLVSILLPALNRAREQAKFVICQSNLHSYGQLAFLYIADNNDSFPDPWESFYSARNFPEEISGTFHRYCRWHNPYYDLTLHPEFAGPFWKYLAAKDVHICPVFASKIAPRFGPYHPYHMASIPLDKPNYSYSMNGYLGERKYSRMRRGSEIFFFGEENLWITSPYNSFAFNDTAFYTYGDKWGYGKGDSFGTFHKAKDADFEDGVANAVFLDGHVSTVEREDTWRWSAEDGEKYSPL